MSAAPAKFTFDLDMGATQKPTRVLTDEKLAQMLEEAQAKGHAQGMLEGRADVVANAARELTAAGQHIAQNAVQLIGGIDKTQKELLTSAVELAISVGRKLSTQLMARHPELELINLLEECLASLESAPHLLIRCNPALTDKIQELAEPLIAASGYAGRLVIMGDPEIELGDGRIEWADGGLVRDTQNTNSHINDSINAYLDAHGIPSGKEANNE